MGIFNKVIEIFRKIVIGYVFYTFPLTLMVFLILPYFAKGKQELIGWLTLPYYGVFINTLARIAIYQFVIWIMVSLLFSITMFFSKNNREIFIRRLSGLSGLKERDEREVQIIGKALRTSYLSTITILLFLLFVSLFYVQYHTKSDDNPERGKYPSALFINTGFPFLDSKAFVTQKEGYDVFLEFDSLPLSKSGLILILLVWQIVSFRIVSRRALKLPD